MLLLLTVGVSLCLIVLVSFLYRGRDRRITLLRLTCVALLASTVCREIGAHDDSVLLDLCKRMSLLTAQTSVVLLVLSFRTRPVGARIERRIILAAVLLGVARISLAPWLPIDESGEIYPKADLEHAAAIGKAWSLVLFHVLGWIPFSLATVVVAEGARRIMVQREQPVPIRAATACIFIGAALTGVFILSAALSLTEIPVVGSKGIQKALFVLVVMFFVIGLAIGVVRRVAVDQQQGIAARLAAWTIRPVWCAATALHPDVKLSVDDQVRRDPLRRLSRLTVEAHDALRLIREDDDPALRPIHAQPLDGPELSARLLRHLGGDRALPRLSIVERILFKIRMLHLRDDRTLSESVRSLLQVRSAFDAQAALPAGIEGR